MIHGSYVAAIETYLCVNPRSAVLLNKIGMAYHHMYALDTARKYYQQALAMNPSYGGALNNLAAVYYGQHDYKRAEHTYKQALDYQPQSAIVYANLGTVYLAQEKYKPGAEAYRKALALDPHVFDPGQITFVNEVGSQRENVAIKYYLAKIYASAGKTQEALGCLRNALDAGFHDEKQLMKDKEFATLRSTPEFHQLMEQHGSR
jgi:tetratricopeptide (TPR) repeat protein